MKVSRPFALGLLGAVAFAVAVACSDKMPNTDGGADTGIDSLGETSNDAPLFQEAGSNDAAEAATVYSYSALNDTSKWSTFDLATVNVGAVGFAGAAFDGRYVYFVPAYNGAADGLVVRYDTLASFTSSSAWSTFDTTTVNVGAKGFYGAAFDGRFVYFIPTNNGALNTTVDGIVARYDTLASFTMGSSWSTFDATTVNATAKGFGGAVFDGRYLYLVPCYDGSANDGVVARYDSQAPFTTSSSWSTFDTSTVNSAAAGFETAVFDGRFIYFVPYNNVYADGVVARYDTQANFTTTSSWSTFDMTTVNINAKGYNGGAFDGRYTYFVPFSGLIGRYDTTGTFTNAGSWAIFDLTTVNAAAMGFRHAAFDGRYVYFVPFDNGAGYGYTPDGVVARYDTQAMFTTAISWSTFDTTTVNVNAEGFVGAAFDGRYVYFVPSRAANGLSGVVARFDAKTPPALPSGYAHGSFF